MGEKKLSELAGRLLGVRRELDDIATELDEVKNAEYSDETQLSGLLTRFYYLKCAYDDVDKQAKRIYHHVDFLSKVVIPSRMEEQGVSKLQVDECGKSFYPLTKNTVRVLDKEPAFNWLVEHGGDALISKTVNAQSLAGFMKDFILEKGIDPPEDIFEMKSYQVTGMSSFNPKT